MDVTILATLGSEWKKGDLHRIYFNNLGELYGLECGYYNTGNVASARLNGEPISNTHARELLLTFDDAKVYYDVADGRFHARGLDKSVFETIVAAIRQRVADAAVVAHAS